MGALYLQEMDTHFGGLSHVVYARYMDDIVILAKTRWQLRKHVRQLNEFLGEKGLNQHPDKTFIGRVTKGFDWMGAWLDNKGVRGVAPRARANHRAKVQRLYERAFRWRVPKGVAQAQVSAYRLRWQYWVAGLLAIGAHTAVVGATDNGPTTTRGKYQPGVDCHNGASERILWLDDGTGDAWAPLRVGGGPEAIYKDGEGSYTAVLSCTQMWPHPVGYMLKFRMWPVYNNLTGDPNLQIESKITDKSIPVSSDGGVDWGLNQWFCNFDIWSGKCATNAGWYPGHGPTHGGTYTVTIKRGDKKVVKELDAGTELSKVDLVYYEPQFQHIEGFVRLGIVLGQKVIFPPACRLTVGGQEDGTLNIDLGKVKPIPNVTTNKAFPVKLDCGGEGGALRGRVEFTGGTYAPNLGDGGGFIVQSKEDEKSFFVMTMDRYEEVDGKHMGIVEEGKEGVMNVGLTIPTEYTPYRGHVTAEVVLRLTVD